MSIEERRREEKEQRRRAIVEAAETVLAHEGCEAMTMSDIATEARLSRSLLYVYFEDMDDSVLALTLRALRSLSQQFESAVAARQTGLQQLRAIGEAYVDFTRDKPIHSSPNSSPVRQNKRSPQCECSDVLRRLSP